MMIRMRERTRAELRQIAGAISFETVMRYADALARSPHAEQTMETTARRVATEVADAIADKRVPHAEEIVQAVPVAGGPSVEDGGHRPGVVPGDVHQPGSAAGP
jgi:hypothetical protein